MQTTIKNGAVYVNDVHQDNLLAFPMKAAALLIGVSYWTVRREILRRKLRSSSTGLIAREELLRYLREEEKPKARAPRSSHAERNTSADDSDQDCAVVPDGRELPAPPADLRAN
ncbi:MAG TPA: hypothetical protein VI454_13635 [Verrucomicrobiae bacterium]|jgi:hypothetical protein